MKNNHIKGYLLSTVLMSSILLILASHFLNNEVLNNTISPMMKEKSQQILQNYVDDVRWLKTVEPKETQDYKKKFLPVNEELLIYQQPELLKGLLQISIESNLNEK